ncbi:MAG: class I SAM-dependent methyltransferase [Candidatus Angelobacter sp.]
MRWFRGAGTPPAGRPESTASAPRISRRSTALGDFMRSLRPAGEEKLRILDLGPTSPDNIAFLTKLGLRVYNEDVLRAAQDLSCKVSHGSAVEPEGAADQANEQFFVENLDYPPSHFDAVLFWDVLEYLPEPLVKPLVERIQGMLKPHGALLAFFHAKDAGSESNSYRYHIVQADTVELERKAAGQLQRIFQNRHVENLFKDFASRKFFLGRDNIREVIVVR